MHQLEFVVYTFYRGFVWQPCCMAGTMKMFCRPVAEVFVRVFVLTAIFIKALCTLIRFQTKTELFCSVFKKICVHTHFRFVFARPHYNAISVLKNAFIYIPSLRMLKSTRRMRISIFWPAKLARN